MKRVLLLTVVLLVALVSAACGGDSTPAEPAAPAGEAINVVMHDIYFGDTNDNHTNPPVWTVTSGATVTVSLDNQGALQHNWAIVKPGAEVPNPFIEAENADLLLFAATPVDGGAQGTATFTAPEPGEYIVICTVSGHYPMMQGKLVVT